MYVTTGKEYDLEIIICFACIGRGNNDNLCSNSYLRNINRNHILHCGVQGYNKSAIRKRNIEQFNNSIHKIIMTTTQCLLCDKHCIYPDMLCTEIRRTITKYKEVVGII